MMIRSSTRSVSVWLSLTSVLSEPTQSLGGSSVTSLFIVAPGVVSLRARRRGFGLSHADPLGPLPALPLPAVDGLAELEEGDDPRRDRQPERDHAIGEDRGEHLRAGHAEEYECADHPGVDCPHPTRGEGK